MRWGELTELRVRDFDFGAHLVTVSRAVVELNPKYHPVIFVSLCWVMIS
jgi:hypothetical protein